MINNILKLLGLFGNSSNTNKATGILNYAWFIPTITWAWWHRAETIIIQVVLNIKGKQEIITLLSTTYLGLSLIILGFFVYIEVNRRTNYKDRGNNE